MAKVKNFNKGIVREPEAPGDEIERKVPAGNEGSKIPRLSKQRGSYTQTLAPDVATRRGLAEGKVEVDRDPEPDDTNTGGVLRTGGCLCGAVRFSVRNDPLRVGLCHCQDCRRSSGSALSFFGVWPRSAYEGTGQLSTFEGRSFCPNCGSRVVSLREDEAEIMLGSMDAAPSDLIPSYELWIGRREPWIMDLQWAEQFEQDRESRAIAAPSMDAEIPSPHQ